MFDRRVLFSLIAVVLGGQLWTLGCADFEDSFSEAFDDGPGGSAGDGVMPLIDPADGDLVPRFAPGEDGFYRMPWPSDARLAEDGSVEVGDMPTRNLSLVKDYINALRAVRGYSTLPVVYMPFESAEGLDESALPAPAETRRPNSTVQLMELSEDGCGVRTPLEVKFDRNGGDFIDPQTLKVAPMPGWVLRAQTPYALIVTTDFGGAGHKTARTAAFTDYLNGEEADTRGLDPRVVESFEPLRRCLPKTDLSAEKIAVATVFHTQDPVEESRLLREAVWQESTPVQELESWAKQVVESNAQKLVYRGSAPFPIFQQGSAPYHKQGGLVFGADGLPEIQRWESVPFLLVMPAEHSGPLKLMIWEDGTGAVLGNSLRDRHTLMALNNGFAIAIFVPQFHQFRKKPGQDEVLHSFNFTNPTSGRTVFRQQAAETSYFIRLLEEKVIHQEGLPPIDTERIYYGGHSQGSLVGALVAGLEPRIDTYVFSGVSAYLTETILSRKDPFDIVDLLGELLKTKDTIDRLHPMVQFAQTGADAVDPQNYAPHWRGWAEHPEGSNVLIINGQHDDTTSVLGMNALMCAGDIAPAGAPGWNIDPDGLRDVSQLNTPVKSNQTAFDGSPLTIGAILDASTGHFTLYDKTYASDAAVHFWVSSATGEAEIKY